MSYDFATASGRYAATIDRGKQLRSSMGNYDRDGAARDRDSMIGGGLGDTLAEPADITTWRAYVRARGNADVIAPRGLAFAGQLAERISAANIPAGKQPAAPAVKLGFFWYVPAPARTQALWRAMAQDIATAQARGDAVTRIQSLPGTVLDDAGKLARTGVSALTGIPTWAIPVLLIGGGAFVLMSAAHSFLPDRR